MKDEKPHIQSLEEYIAEHPEPETPWRFAECFPGTSRFSVKELDFCLDHAMNETEKHFDWDIHHEALVKFCETFVDAVFQLRKQGKAAQKRLLK